jgi:hypothetical protein
LSEINHPRRVLNADRLVVAIKAYDQPANRCGGAQYA